MRLCPVHVGKAAEESALFPVVVSQLLSTGQVFQAGEHFWESGVSLKLSEHPSYR